MTMKQRFAGFTIFEMVIVLIMVGILTAGIAPMLLRQHTNTMEEKDRLALEDAKTAIINYAISFGGIPDPVENATACSTTLTTVPGIMPPQTGCATAVSAFGVNNWGTTGSGYPFRLDVNDALKSSYVTAVSTGTPAQTGGDRVVFCQAVQQQMNPLVAYCTNPANLTSGTCTGGAAGTWITPSCSDGAPAHNTQATCVAAGATWANAPEICSDTRFNHLSATDSKCTLPTITLPDATTQPNPNPNPTPVAFVLMSAGNNRAIDQENALANTANPGGAPIINRIYENDSRGINNSPGDDHYDDQVKSYPLSALARDCREKMGVSAEVMSCTPGQKYVGSVTNSHASSYVYAINGSTPTYGFVPGNSSFTAYVNFCHARTEKIGIAVSTGVLATDQAAALANANLPATLALSARDTNSDGRIDFVIDTTGVLSSQ